MSPTPTPRLELISFQLCPFVQRSVITLKQKKAVFDVTYVDLDHPPQWFEKISPMGKVPVLRVGEQTALFESAVINEYLDETIGKPMLSPDPLERAFERAWIAFGSELLTAQYFMTTETNTAQLENKLSEFFSDLERLEPILSKEGPYFRGREFSLADAAFAPLFMRLELSTRLREDPGWSRMPLVLRWKRALLETPSVRESVVPDFDRLYVEFCKEAGSLIYR